VTKPRAPLALVCALACAGLLAACGDSGDDGGASATSSAQRTLEKTFGATATSIDRAKIVASVRLDPEGLLKLGGPIAIDVDGPFAAPTRSSASRFDLALKATLGGDTFQGAAISTGSKSFLKLDDTTYSLGSGTRRAHATSSAETSHPGLKSLGIDPLRWVTGIRSEGAETVAGVDTQRLAGDVDAKRLLADVGTLLDKAGAELLSPELLGQIGDAVKSAKVDIWTGSDDSILRQLKVVVRFAFEPAQSPIVGLDGGLLTVKVRLDDVNGAPVQIAAPTGTRPLTEVTGAGGLTALLGGLGAAITGGIGGGAVELVGCVTGADGSAVELVRCVSKLSA